MIHASNMVDRRPFLDTLSPGARTALTQLGSRHRFTRDDVLISEGDHEQDLVLLHQGLVKVTVQLGRDRPQLVDIKIAGDVVGELAALDRRPRSATVTACGEVVATVIPSHELQTFLLANSEVLLALTRVLSGGLRRSDRWRLEFGCYPVLVRLARVLVELAASYGRQERNAVRIDVNLSQPEFAALIGCRAGTAHNALIQLGRQNLITTGLKQTYVRDIARLRKVAKLGMPVTQRHDHNSH
ncbi:Crp/Fnr family transcriptional regulator [Streptomyces profundus]|uniref:Crp/Fnr family transcriptional regulator n=1 Tax=Streptomyces profundus TaxID=2867410 RepID=UPI001D15F613|nr:Crp/Fnr family transcriptional regulator [Streptomyces sp. MA3_2.13]UED87960.1 Crp/Fnr family transcriptional regulator [Streptomyces sp. MA3_2.13]